MNKSYIFIIFMMIYFVVDCQLDIDFKIQEVISHLRVYLRLQQCVVFLKRQETNNKGKLFIQLAS